MRSMGKALAEADSLCGAGYGERTDERTNRRSGYRTRAGTVAVALSQAA
ncbi:hypothetical protein ABT340_31895 [Streptosporangium sp. NPDC000239]